MPRHESVDADRHQRGDAGQHRRPARDNSRLATVPSAMTMISADSTKSVRIAPVILSFSIASSSAGVSRERGQVRARGARRPLLFRAAAVRDFLEALVAQVQAAEHQQRRHAPRAGMR